MSPSDAIQPTARGPPMTTRIDLLDTLRAGLPPTDAPRRHVVIVGAGMAGLTAGLLLKEAGHTVTILEARNRLGGRVYTYRGFAGRMYGEFGAMRFPRQHLLGPAPHPRAVPAADGAVPDGRRGHLRPARRPARATQRVHARRASTSRCAERARHPPADLLKRAMAAAHRAHRAARRLGQLVEQYDRYSLLGYLIERGVSEGARALHGPAAQPRGSLPLLARGVVLPLPRGCLRRPRVHRRRRRYAAERVLARAHRRHPLGRRGPRHRAGAERRDRALPGRGRHRGRGDGRRVHRDRAVRAAAAHGDRRPRHRQGFTLRNVYYGRAHKIFMQFSRKWWIEDDAITHGVDRRPTSPSGSRLHAGRPGPATSRKGVLIASYAWEQDSWPTAMLTERRAHHPGDGRPVPDPSRGRDTFEFGVSHDWALDPYARRHRAAVPAVRDDVSASTTTSSGPCGRVWFANDACDQRGAALDRGRHRGGHQERVRHPRRACATSCRRATRPTWRRRPRQARGERRRPSARPPERCGGSPVVAP